MSGFLKRVTLCELQPNITNGLIIGIIIAKQQPHTLKNNLSFDGNPSERAVWNFTLRDSRVMYINATCWGSVQGISDLNKNFNVGDVVEIHRPLIEIRKSNNYGEQFRPNVTSPYYLTLSDNPELNIKKYEGKCALYQELMNLPTKPIAGAYTIVDIHSKKETLQGVDIFGVLRQIGKTRSITTQDGQTKSVRDVTILDRTDPGLRISIWDPDLINRVETWKIFETVLFITNVQCKWSDFFKSTVATVTSSSIITENPIGKESESLRKHAKETAALQPYGFDDFSTTFPNPSTIRNVMNIKQIIRKAQSSINSTNVDDKQFCALLFVFVTHLDLDGVSRCIAKKCAQCNVAMYSSATACSNDSCIAESNGQAVPVISNFDLRLTLSDHSGSLSNCSLSGLLAESVLNCNVQEFLAMTDEQKSNLKWKFLMERCEIRIGVSCVGFRAPMYTILGCKLARAFEVGNQLPHY